MNKKKKRELGVQRNRYYMVKGIYYLYHKNEVVYIGMSTTNCMRRIIQHYDDETKVFDSFEIFNMHNKSNESIKKREIDKIKQKLPKYNKIHANMIDNKYWMTEDEDDELLSQSKTLKK